MNDDPAWTSLRTAIDGMERGGVVAGVSVEGPSGARFGHNAARRFVAASTIKIPVLIELFNQMGRGALPHDAPYRLRHEDKVGGTGVLSGLGDGVVLTMADLAFLMMSVSDNTATNVLIDRVGMAHVQATMRALGMRRSTLAHRMRGRHVDDPEHENWAVPDEFAAVVRAMLDGAVGSADGAASMIALMERQQNDRRIARHLPEQGRPRWGSKTGSLPGITNDVGFVMGPDGPVVLAIFLEAVPDAHTGEAMIGDLARAVLHDLRNDPSDRP